MFDKILKTITNPETTTARILLLLGFLSFISGVVGEVTGFGRVLEGFEWVLISFGVILLAGGVALELLLEKEEREAAAFVSIGGVIIASILAAIFLFQPQTPDPEPTAVPTAISIAATNTATAVATLTATATPTAIPTETVTSSPTTMVTPPSPTATDTPIVTLMPTSTATPTFGTYRMTFHQTLREVAGKTEVYGLLHDWRQMELCVANRSVVDRDQSRPMSCDDFRLNENFAVLLIPSFTSDNEMLPRELYQYGYTEIQTHEVVLGDTFWDLANFYYGHGSLWPEICVANRDILTRAPDSTNVWNRDCGQLKEGQTLRIPLLARFVLPTATPTEMPSPSPSPTSTAMPSTATFTVTPTATSLPATEATATIEATATTES